VSACGVSLRCQPAVSRLRYLVCGAKDQKVKLSQSKSRVSCGAAGLRSFASPTVHCARQSRQSRLTRDREACRVRGSLCPVLSCVDCRCRCRYMFLLGTWCGVVCFLMSGDGSDGSDGSRRRLGGWEVLTYMPACLRVCMSACLRRSFVGWVSEVARWTVARWRGGEDS